MYIMDRFSKSHMVLTLPIVTFGSIARSFILFMMTNINIIVRFLTSAHDFYSIYAFHMHKGWA